MQHPYFYIYNKIKKIDFGKFRVFSLNFNLLSIIFSLILISSIQILLISTAFFFNLSFAIKNLKLKIEIKTDYDHLISKEDVLKRKVHLKGEQIECFQYGKITLDICDNAFFYKKEKYPLNVVSEYLNSKNMIISDLSFEDFEVLKMLKY